jgi:AcrR family transcriptional regulator
MRADARRNYDRLIAAAHEVFAREGGGASMEAIAKAAGVGVGTLYRHFPKRIDLVEAVYRSDVDELILAADKAEANLEPWAALESFLHAFVRYAQGKRTFINELYEAFEKNPGLRSETRERVDEALGGMLARAQKAGAARSDIEGTDLFQLMGPMCMSPTLGAEQSERLLAMILDGLRAPR